MLDKIRLDSAGLSEVLTSAAVRGAVVAAANNVAANASGYTLDDGEEIDVEVDEYVATGGRLRGERAAASVRMAHPAALAVEAKHGHLAAAARAAGLETRAKGVR